ncbi:MAG: indolepyruvate ferredoxin oxidoreductase subunit alpha [Coriobacteriia bacterium]|nr:indolepyruvate ferredoxin oxidoreductase subunit alpha [Coriobacteriia bacterium]
MAHTLLSGNEAIAQGAWEAGVLVGAAYPGTPSTEILQNLVRKPGVHCEWAPNEKVALEVGLGASLGGARVLVTMKHVGLNVASDPFMTLAYTGVGGGLVLVVADDPGMHSSQNEQDSRAWGPFAKVVILEPSDSAEALAMTRDAFELSERLDMPILIRSTTRLSHAKGLVETGERAVPEGTPYAKAPAKWVMMPGNAKARRVDLDKRLEVARAASESCAFTVEEIRDSSLGVVTSGVVYQYVREALPDASTLKLGMTHPLPVERLRAFAAKVDRLVVVEELDPYLSLNLKALGLPVSDTTVPHIGELSPAMVGAAFGALAAETREPMRDLPPRPPMLCPGCPHRGVFQALRSMGAVVTGDIGCYTLAALQPLAAMDTCVDMGASIAMAHGLELAGGAGDAPIVAVIGDSTFAHSGLTGLMNAVYNNGSSTLVILDNRITAMTGHQDNPFTGRTLCGDPAIEIDIEQVVRALGVADVHTVNPNLLKPTAKALAHAAAHDGVSVVIAKAPCALLNKDEVDPFAVDEDECTACGECIRLGCPAISRDSVSKACIDTTICVGCRQCVQVCKYGAIVRTGKACDIGSGA